MARKRELMFKENPYIQEYATTTKFKRVITSATNPDGSFVMSVIGRDPLNIKDTGLMQVTTKIVDPTPFIKFKAQAINALYKLNSAGIKLFALLCDLLQGYEGKDKLEVILSWDLLTDEQRDAIGSKSTFMRGINDLIKGDFVAPSVVSNLYYVNPKMLYNGDSVVVATQYIKNGTETAVKFTQVKNKIRDKKMDSLFPEEDENLLPEGKQNEKTATEKLKEMLYEHE